MGNQYDNIDFYEKVPVQVLEKYASIGGFDDCCDVKLILPFLKKAASILDVGAGYGRVIDFILKEGLKAKITAVERSASLCKILQDRFSGRIDIHNEDIEAVGNIGVFDVVIFMWSNISEWLPDKKKLIIEKLSSFLDENGFLVIEIFIPDQKPLNSTHYDSRKYEAKTEYGNVHGYNLTRQEVLDLIAESGLGSIKELPYKTKTGRERQLFICQK